MCVTVWPKLKLHYPKKPKSFTPMQTSSTALRLTEAGGVFFRSTSWPRKVPFFDQYWGFENRSPLGPPASAEPKSDQELLELPKKRWDYEQLCALAEMNMPICSCIYCCCVYEPHSFGLVLIELSVHFVSLASKRKESNFSFPFITSPKKVTECQIHTFLENAA